MKDVILLLFELLACSAIIIKPSTLLRFHTALKNRKYQLLFSTGSRKPGPKGQSKEVIHAIIDMKKRNPVHGKFVPLGCFRPAEFGPGSKFGFEKRLSFFTLLAPIPKTARKLVRHTLGFGYNAPDLWIGCSVSSAY